MHGRKEFVATLLYKELAKPITETFHSQIELEAFMHGVKLTAKYFGEPQVSIAYPQGWQGSIKR
jgi:hypothetical protein